MRNEKIRKKVKVNGEDNISLEQIIAIRKSDKNREEGIQYIGNRAYPDAYGFFFLDMPAFKIWNRGNEIFFTGEIYEDSIDDLIQKVDDVLESIVLHKAKYRIDLPLVLHIDSIGGSVTQGFRAIDYISARTKELGIEWVTCATGKVASMGFVLWVSGDKLRASRNAVFLVHQIRGVLHGKRQDIKDYMKMFDDLHKLIVNHISKKTGISKDEVEKLLQKESWLTSEEIKKLIKIEVEITG